MYIPSCLIEKSRSWYPCIFAVFIHNIKEYTSISCQEIDYMMQFDKAVCLVNTW